MNKSLFLALVLSLFFMSCKGTKYGASPSKAGFNFVQSKTLSNVLDIAEEKNKLVFVDIYTDWCMPCKMMDEDVFSDKALGEYFDQHFISYKVNAEKGTGPNIAFLYEVYAYPTLLFLDAKGKVLSQKVGAAYHTELRNLAAQALAMKEPVN